jgi:hypothetical protein
MRGSFPKESRHALSGNQAIDKVAFVDRYERPEQQNSHE